MDGAVFRALVADGKLISTAPGGEVEGAQEFAAGSQVFEHPRIAFPTYPFEWHPLMLADAAAATMEIAQAIAPSGYTLKDATPYNILFQGAKPVLVDVLSIEDRKPGYPYWLAEGQFVRTFLLPLLAYCMTGIAPKQIFLASREGLESKEVRRMADAWAPLRFDYWLYVLLPALLQGRNTHMSAAYRREVSIDRDRATFVYQSTLKRLANAATRSARKVQPQQSAWSAYTEERAHYSDRMLELKRTLVDRWFQENRPGWVLDIGANTGEFSELAARHGSSVVAVESDLDSVGAIYCRARQNELNVLAVHMNFAHPSPGTGWQGGETLSFKARGLGRFDCVLMLAVIHHLAITEAIPMEAIIAEVADLTRDALIIEHVAPTDPMCQLLVRGRDFLAMPLNRDAFETVLRRYFEIVEANVLEGSTRALYICRRKH
jgi:SAM-dependent methyltransferase